jgi:hypothetical protein
VEALCAAEGFVLVGGESVIEADGRRWAPVARTRFESGRLGRWTPFRLRLTTPSGKLSSLSCDLDDGDEIEAYAIERHYGETHILRFELPATGAVTDVEPEVVADFGWPDLPNMEGVSREGERLVIVTDHEPREGGGTTEVIILGPLRDE